MSVFEPVVGVMPFWFLNRDRNGLLVRGVQVRCLFFNPEYVASVYRDRAVLEMGRVNLLEDQKHERKGQLKGMGKIER